MTGTDRETRPAALAGTLASLAMIAYQMAGKATRDAIFLSTHPATSLPAMLIAAAAVSLAIALTAGRLAERVDPGRVVPVGFAVSAVLTLAEWALIGRWPAQVAIVVYLHFTGLGALLVSGFWSVVNERFDPRSAKRVVSRIAAGGTAGGLLGGILAERAAVWFSVEAMFPVLAVLHVAAGLLTVHVARGRTPYASATWGEDVRPSGLALLARWPYLRWLTVLVLTAGIAEGLLDLAFKSAAAASFGSGTELLRFFAAFYTIVGLATVVFQTTLTRRVVQRYGVTGSAAILPGTVAAGALGVLFIPGAWALIALRGVESLFRNSLYRSGYELLFNPLAPREKRAIKPLLDVGVSRIGDSVAGAMMQIIIWLAAAAAAITAPAVALAMVFAGAAALSARQLHRGYQESLERSLLAHGRRLETDPFDDPTQTAILQTMGAIDITQLARRPSATLDPPEPAGPGTSATTGPATVPARLEPDVARILELQSRDEARVRAALHDAPLSPRLVSFVVPLLAWDAVARDAIKALRPIAARATGVIVDNLLDPESDFSVRRRLPLVLVESPTPRAVEGLLHGLEDRRFEVRYRCGRVLARLHDAHAQLPIDRARVLAAVEREAAVDRGVWQSHRLLDEMDDVDWSPVLDEVVRDRASRSLEHVFTMLSLVLPAQPLRVAYRGLHTEDRMLRGTALEYLETALPERIRAKLWPFLEASSRPSGRPRKTGEVLEDLLRSQESIAHRLEVLKRLRERERPPGTDAE